MMADTTTPRDQIAIAIYEAHETMYGDPAYGPDWHSEAESLRDQYRVSADAVLSVPLIRQPLTPDEIRDVAVGLVDAGHGYTMEFSSLPQQHAREYDDMEERLSLALSVVVDLRAGVSQ